MRQKILKTGNSLGLTIPSKFVRILGLKPGDDVEVKSDLAKGILRCTFTGTGQMTLLSSAKK
jgi:antitoxin component of MazEF toxin-antitoxin module